MPLHAFRSPSRALCRRRRERDGVAQCGRYRTGDGSVRRRHLDVRNSVEDVVCPPQDALGPHAVDVAALERLGGKGLSSTTEHGRDDPIGDVRVRVTGGQYDPELSSEMAFRTAAVMATREIVEAAEPALLEPIMSLEIMTPAEHMGDVLGDLNGRRGKVNELAARGPSQVIRARVPLAEMFGYSTAIRSLTKGRATYTQEPEKFEIVPQAIRDEILNR